MRSFFFTENRPFTFYEHLRYFKLPKAAFNLGIQYFHDIKHDENTT